MKDQNENEDKDERKRFLTVFENDPCSGSAGSRLKVGLVGGGGLEKVGRLDL